MRLAPRAATLKAMGEVSAPVIAVGLVLSAVFIWHPMVQT